MNTDNKSTATTQSNGCLIKVILGTIIFIMAVALGATESGRVNPIVVMITCPALFALWKWKPGQSSDSTEISVKPLDKEKTDE
jgi:hypothetical protein